MNHSPSEPLPSKDVSDLIKYYPPYQGYKQGREVVEEGAVTICMLLAEIERLHTALRGVQSCSTCEACRGAATLALGGQSSEPASGKWSLKDVGINIRADHPAPEPASALRPDGMPEPSLEVLKRVAARMREIGPDTAYLAQWAVEQIEEHDQSFDLRWKADMRAIKRWQEAHPGNDLTWPDHADLCVWLLEQLDARATQPPPAAPGVVAEEDC